MNDVLRTMENHRSVRSFTDQPVKKETLEAILRAGQMASTSNFIQAYSVIQVAEKSSRQVLYEVSNRQDHVLRAPVFLVFLADLNRIRVASDLQGMVMDKGSVEALLLATIDASLFAQNAMVAAESLGLGGVYIGALRNDPKRVSETLKLPPDVYPVFGMCLGYPDVVNGQKLRLPLDLVWKQEVYGGDEGDAVLLRTYDASVQAYYATRENGARKDSWTAQVARMFSRPLRPHMKEFLMGRNFNTK